jgi:hypothetical protein
VDAASDRLRTALADADVADPELLGALRSIKARARAIAHQVDETLPLG